MEPESSGSGYMSMLPLWGEYPYIQEHHHHRLLPRRRNINKIIKKRRLGVLDFKLQLEKYSDQRDLKKRSGSLKHRNTIKIDQNTKKGEFRQIS